MKKLKDILPESEVLNGTIPAVEISGITLDSRKAGPGMVFFAIPGTRADGHQFISQVVEQGAAAIVGEQDLNPGIPYIRVKNSAEMLGRAASAFYDNPSSRLQLVGVTGTNGKTTIATLLYDLFKRLGYKTGLLSTVRNRIHETTLDSTHTTPDAVSLNALLARMADEGCDYCFMEVSSHAIHQHRIAGLTFRGGIFSNLTHDHLDYHGTFDNYLKAKKAFFDTLPADAFALTNKDDRNGLVMLQNTKATRYTYALLGPADFKARVREHDFNGMLLDIDGTEAWYRLVGGFNAYNLLAVYGAAFLLGVSREEIITHLTQLGSVSGRFDYLRSDHGVIGIVDYAHTPDALENILKVINEVRTKNEQLITVFGCGGDRDKAKRPVMAEVACRLATRVIFTSDNPRSEDPEQILREMEAGVPPQHFKKTIRITDRKEAIKAAVAAANPGDIILVAGKGHETYQDIRGVKFPFDDKAILQEMFHLMKS